MDKRERPYLVVTLKQGVVQEIQTHPDDLDLIIVDIDSNLAHTDLDREDMIEIFQQILGERGKVVVDKENRLGIIHHTDEGDIYRAVDVEKFDDSKSDSTTGTDA